MLRSLGTNEAILPDVLKTMNKIKKYGDQTLWKKYKERYGKNYSSIQVTKAEVKQAYKNIDNKFIQALRQAIKNITLVQQAQLTRRVDSSVSPESGISVTRVWRSIDRVGLYIPGGKAIYPSSVLMSAIPARIAGCKDIILCSPPSDNGTIPAATIVAADMAGITKIYKVGGVEAVAAMTYGTQTIPSVYKIFGAGNSFVTAAKTIAQKVISIDMPAGPSEVFIIADKTANPAFIAADLLADGEHGYDSACVLVTTSADIAKETLREIEKQLKNLSTADRVRTSLRKYGLVAVADTMEEIIAFTNEYAPEHLEIMTKDPKLILNNITNAGSVFLGDWTAKASGDYATGANHILPTGGMAKMYPPLGVDAFGKWMQVQTCSKKGLRTIKDTIETLASVEQLPAHKNSVTIRFLTKGGDKNAKNG